MQTILFASVAHDLRTPLNSLLASNKALIPMMGGNESAISALGIQRSSIHFLISLVEDVLDLSKMQFNKLELSESWFSLHDLIKEVLHICNFQAQSRALKLLSTISLDPEYEVCSDGKRIKQILINLVINALKFTYSGSVTIEVALQQQGLNHSHDWETDVL
jgi:signal transduction histidine kinase